MHLGEKLKTLRTEAGLTQEAVATKLDVKRSAYAAYETGRVGIDPDLLQKVSKLYGASIENLLDETNSVTYTEKRRVLKNVKAQGMPVFETAPVTLSNTPSYRDEKQMTPDFWLSIPQYRDCTYACRAKGDSMHPVVRNHALVGGKEITEFSVIVFGDIYIIHTKNGIETIKYIHPDPQNDDKILLVPYNDSAKTTPIHKSEILRLYVAEFVINPL